MDKQREKLIELIKEAKKNEAFETLMADIDSVIDMPHGDEYLAYYLLANGVIVLPCDKGTKLKYDGIDYEVDHWNIIASAFNENVEKGRSRVHLFDIEEAYKTLEGVE